MLKPQIAVVFVISLAVWIFFKWQTPEAPLGPVETVVVVVAVGALVLAASWILRKSLRKKDKPA